MEAKHHILLLGGTGICGLIFTRAALEAGHKLTLYARAPSKIPAELCSNANLFIIQGELADVEGLKKSAACGADVFISLAGPTLGKREGTRILILSTPSYSAPEDLRSIKWFFAINFYIRVIGGDSYQEIKGMAEETVALGENIDWTVFRVPLLQGRELEENDGEINAVYVGDKKWRDGLHLDRGRLARWILRELDEGKWIRASPTLANA